ncbi:four and a half LIM domains protein 5 isoform X2 [Lutra lutra]|uniref:four and a half LIM domains protein 5 isoform X2 n=1 Tax=Lutra lutra TaxID=9657 RepID=UPI001FD2D745|nr:four and a half LIM domains protein 5 isoform X2 [Lutra lutra]
MTIHIVFHVTIVSFLTIVRSAKNQSNQVPRIFVTKADTGMKHASTVPNAITLWWKSLLLPRMSACCAQSAILTSAPASASTARRPSCLVLIWGGTGSRKMEFKGNYWHETCFVCEHCRQPIGTKPLISKESGNYCVPCFEKEFAHYCSFCKKVITSGGITFHDQPWHKECFLCSGCRKELCEEEFMSRDDYPFCLDCYNHLYAKKCAACTKSITGLRGAKFICFQDRQWHSECFNCGKCSVSLVGEGFLTQNKEIFCRKCGSGLDTDI